MLAVSLDLAALGQFLLGVAAILGSALGFITLFFTLRIKKEVTTINAQTLAQLADATETRRIEDKPMEEQTDADRDHLRSVEEGNR